MNVCPSTNSDGIAPATINAPCSGAASSLYIAPSGEVPESVVERIVSSMIRSPPSSSVMPVLTSIDNGGATEDTVARAIASTSPVPVAISNAFC